MDRAQRLGGDLGRLRVRRTVQPDGERVKARPPGLATVIFLDAPACDLDADALAPYYEAER